MHSANRRGYSNIEIHFKVFYKIVVALIHNVQHQLRGQPAHFDMAMPRMKCAKEKNRGKLADPQGNRCHLPPASTY